MSNSDSCIPNIRIPQITLGEDLTHILNGGRTPGWCGIPGDTALLASSCCRAVILQMVQSNPIATSLNLNFINAFYVYLHCLRPRHIWVCFFFFKPMSVEISEKCFTCSTKFQSSITRLTSVELNTEIPISAGRGPGQPYPQGKFRGILEAQTFVKTCFKIYVNTILMYKS